MMLFFINVHINHRTMFYYYYHLFLPLPRWMFSNVYQYFNYVQLRPKSSQYNVTTGITIRLCSNPSPWRLDMAGNTVDPDTVLMQHGGITDTNFAKIINEGSDDDEIDLINHSPYYLTSCLPTNLTNGNKLFSVLSLNAQSILAKFTGLQVMLELFASQKIHFHAICIQESWIHDDSKLPLVALEWYQCFSIKATTSSHGGRITYVDDKYDVEVKKTVDDSNI